MVRTDAKHQSASPGKKVQMSAAPYRGAPIRTCPAPTASKDLPRDEIRTTRTNRRAFKRHGENGEVIGEPMTAILEPLFGAQHHD